MTDKFAAIMEQKKGAIIKVMEGLQELEGQPTIYPPDADLRGCSTPEIVYLIVLKERVEGLVYHARTVANAIHNVEVREEAIQKILKELSKGSTPKGGAFFGW